MSQQPSRREDFEIAIICALPLEYDAVVLLFDEFWDKEGDTFGRAAGDLNHYTTGRIGKHDVVLALLSHMGKANAASAAAIMRSSYGALRLVILAGICGGVPYNGDDDIFLGDVVISSSVIQYDFGRHYPSGFMRKNTYADNLRKHDKNIGNLLTKFGTNIGQDKLHERAASFLQELQERALKHREKYTYPGTDKDKLFKSSYRHMHRKLATCVCSSCHGRKDPICDEALASSCDDLGCDEEYLERSRTHKEQDQAQGPAIYIGAVASGDTIMKSGEDRDGIAKKEGVIAFEMGGAGAWEDLPCIVVKGICDYADCHKNKLWRDFAAATAASFSKAILEQYIQTDRSRVRLVEDQPKSHFLVPFGRNKNFIGRETILSNLLEKIRPGADGEDCQRTAIEGLGGVGKTQIALEAVYRLHNEYPDCSIFWVPAIDATGFENAYRNIGKQLNIKGIDRETADIKLLVKTALSEDGSGSWLLVIDDADDVTLLFGDDKLSAYLPFSRNGSILFTTRNREAAVRLDILLESIFNITEMNQDEGLKLLQKGLKESQTSNTEATEKLLDILGNLPLAITQASAYIATKHISTADYLELCQSNPKDMISLLSKDFEDRHRYKEIQNPVATTWLISFNQILRNDPLAAQYLQFMSILAEKDIPRFLLPKSTKLETVGAIGTLKGYAFIFEQERGDSFDMHRLVRLTMRNWLEKKGELKESVASAIQRLNEVMSFPKHDNRQIWMRCLPHAQAILELPEHLTGTQAEATLLFNVAEGNSYLKLYQTAASMYQQALRLDEKLLGKDHSETLTSKEMLGATLSYLGSFKESEKLLRQLLNTKEEILGKDGIETLDTMSRLAYTLTQLGNFTEAERVYRHMLHIQQKSLGMDHLDTLLSISNIAVTLGYLGQYEESMEMHCQALKGREKVLGLNHLDTLASMKHSAIALGDLGRYEEAEKMHRQTFEVQANLLGNDHPDTLTSMHNLAVVLENLYKYDEAVKTQRQALEGRERVFGKEHPDTLTSMSNLALMLGTQGNFEDAVRLHRQTFELRGKVLGKDHPDTLISMDNLRLALKNLENEVENDNQIPPNYDVRSISSEADDMESQTSFTATIEAMAGKGKALIGEALAEQPQFKSLCEKALVKFNRERFVKNMVRLLKSFHECLAEEAESGVEKAVTQLLLSKRGRTQISDQLVARMGHEEALKFDKIKLELNHLDRQFVEEWATSQMAKTPDGAENSEQAIDSEPSGEVEVEPYLKLAAKPETAVDSELLTIEQDQESDAEEMDVDDISEPDNFPFTSELKTFLLASKAFKQLQMRFTLMFLSADLGYILQSIPKDHIWLSKEQDVSISNRFKAFVEISTRIILEMYMWYKPLGGAAF
ncbi:hypothetical protein ACHAPE_002692 [Trichoderma viride]